MLKGQYGGRHQHGYLLVVASGFEGGAYSHLRLAKSHVATDQAVHRARAFHVVLHLLGRFQLVGCVLVEERCLQLVLHIIVGREGEATLVTALGIELDEVARYVLDALLGLLLEFVPSARAEYGEAWRFPRLRPSVFADLVERVDGYVGDVAMLIDQPDHLLVTLASRHAYQSGKLADAEIDVDDKVAWLHLA